MEKKKHARRVFLSVLFAVLTLVSFVMAFFVMSADRYKSPLSLNRPAQVSEGWYIFENGQKVCIDLDKPQKVDNNGHLVIFNDTIFEEYGGMTLSTRSAQYGLRVKVNNIVIYEYNDEGFKRNEQMRESLFCDIQIPKIHEIAELQQIDKRDDMSSYQHGTSVVAFEYNNIDGDNIKIPDITAGSARDIFVAHCLNEIIPLSVILIFLFMTTVLFCTSAIMRYLGVRERRLTNMAFFLLICSLWEATNSPVLQQLFSAPAAVHHISFFMFMLMGVPICSFIINTPGMKRYGSVYMCMLLFYVNIFVQNIVYLTFGIDLSDMLMITHILIAVGIIAVTVSLAKEYRRAGLLEIKLILTAFIMLSVCGMAALSLYWFIDRAYVYYISVFWTGMILFAVFLMYCVIVSMIRSMQFRSEALIYQKIAGTDLMTGLGNHLSFERKIEEIEKTADSFRNIAIIFINLSGMKRLNDTAGYKKGDEIIIAVANSVKKIFGGVGECYRTFGDEFCVIMPDPGPEQDEGYWEEQLKIEEACITRNGMYEITLRWGSSFIRDENGNLKTVSDWKYEADRNIRARH